MRTTIKYILLLFIIGYLPFGCTDNEPEVEDLPSAAVAFTYEVIDNSYQLDYYVGALVEFTSISKLNGTCVWDFGDGNTATGEVVTHKFAEAGTYQVKLTVADSKNRKQPILIKDIVPIMKVDPIEGGICEVLSTPVSISVELPNPEGLSEEYLWIFPAGATDENGNPVTTSAQVNPGKLKFSHVGSQAVRLQVKLGGRVLEEGRVNVPVAFNEAVPTLYYAIKGGNIMALKLVTSKPAGMNIYPFDMAVSSGKHPQNILFNDSSLYVLDCGQQFTYVADPAGLGDGRIIVMAKDGSKVETILSNVGGSAYDDPYYGCIENGYLYFAGRLNGFCRIKMNERNKNFSLTEYPYYVQNTSLGYYNNGLSYAAINANMGKVDGTWYWCKTYTGQGIYRFEDSDIGGTNIPSKGLVLAGITPKSFVYDKARQKFYFTIYEPSALIGLYACTLEQLNSIGDVSPTKLAPYLLKTANGKAVTPITEAGKGEGSSGEFIGICQLTLDESTGCVYFGLRSAFPNEVKSGLMRYNPATGFIEHVIEGVEVYGVAVNNTKSKLF